VNVPPALTHNEIWQTMPEVSEYVSDCCEARLRMISGERWVGWECTKCDQPCDAVCAPAAATGDHP